MFNKHNLYKNKYMLHGSLARRGYDWWWHSFTAQDEEGNEVPFFFEFYIVNPKKKKFDLGIESKKPCFLMVKFGHWGQDHIELNSFIDLKNVKIGKGKNFSIDTSSLHLSNTTCNGSIKVNQRSPGVREGLSDIGTAKFDIIIKKDIAWNVGYGTCGFLRFIKAFQMYWHAEGMKTRYSGTITLNDKKYTIIPEKSYGYADKNWGRGFTSPWVWLSSCNLYSRKDHRALTNSAFDIGGGSPKIYFLPLKRKLLSGFYLDGKEYEFNFSKFWTHTKTKFNFAADTEYVYWYVSQSNKKYFYESKFKCRKSDMIFVHYIDPHGDVKFHKLWNGGNGYGNIKIYLKKTNELVEDINCNNLGCEYGEFDIN